MTDYLYHPDCGCYMGPLGNPRQLHQASNHATGQKPLDVVRDFVRRWKETH